MIERFQEAPSFTSPIRVGLLLNTFDTSNWFYHLIEDLLESERIEIVLVVLNGEELDNKDNLSLLQKAYRSPTILASLAVRKFLDFIYYSLIDRNPQLPSVDTAVSSKASLNAIPTITVFPRKTRYRDYFSASDLKNIREANLDVLIRGGFRILSGPVLTSARFGIWSFHHGDNRENRGGPAGFWESMQNWPVTGSTLQILTEDLNDGIVLQRSFSSTNTMSLRDNRNNYFWKTLKFMRRKLEELHKAGPKRFFDRVIQDNQQPFVYSNRYYRKASNKEYAKLISRKIVKKLSSAISNRLFFNQWQLMYRFESKLSCSLSKFKNVIPPKDRFWADPHIFRQTNGNYFVFLEEYIYATRKGHISVLSIDEHGNFSTPQIALEEPFHLSYPFLISHQGSLFMIPESIQDRSIRLYKCVSFPNEWRFEKKLIDDIAAVDSTVYFNNDRWWLFANVVEIEGASSWDELFLFSTDDLLTGEWVPHERNPIISDCRCARPAGPIFELNGKLYRPSQNCSIRYGFGFNFSEIKDLSFEDYRERLVEEVSPTWCSSILGTHSFDRVGDLTIVDTLVKRRI